MSLDNKSKGKGLTLHYLCCYQFLGLHTKNKKKIFRKKLKIIAVKRGYQNLEQLRNGLNNSEKNKDCAVNGAKIQGSNYNLSRGLIIKL